MSFPEPATLPAPLQNRLAVWLRRWGTPSLAYDLRVEFSPRLRRAFGRCYQEERLIRLTPSLRDSQSHLLAEILCHEAAHAAVFERHGPEARPHGSEWAEMMRTAGFEPRVRIPVVVRKPTARSAANRVVYLHRCPICDEARHATRPMHRWRCRSCVDTTTRGRLEIQRADEKAPARRQAAASGKRARRRRGSTQAPASRRRKK